MPQVNVIELLANHPDSGDHAWVELIVGEHTITIRADERSSFAGKPSLYVSLNDEIGKDILL